MDEPAKTILVYTGIARGTQYPKLFKWYCVDGIENDGSHLDTKDEEREHCFIGKRKCNITIASPGAVYKFTKSPDGKSILSGSGEYLGMWENEDDVVKWQAAASATEKAIKKELQAKKDTKEKRHLEVLRPLRSVYWDLPKEADRAILLAEVIQFIVSYRESRKEP